MYEDQMETQKKLNESAIKQIKISMSEDIEVMTMHFANCSRDLVKETREHRAL